MAQVDYSAIQAYPVFLIAHCAPALQIQAHAECPQKNTSLETSAKGAQLNEY
jgi:hypothetical protein